MNYPCVLRLFRGGKWKCFQTALCPSLYQPLPVTCCQRKFTVPVKKTNFVSPPSDKSLKDTGKELEGLYSSEEKLAILKVLNTASVNELAAFSFLRGKKSVNIVKHREEHGPFQNLDSLMEVPLFQYKITVKVCDAILHPESDRKKREKRTPESYSLGKLIKPGIERKKLKAANSIVSIVFGNEKIAWTHLDNKLRVLDWQQRTNFKLMKETYTPSMYLEKISSIVSEIPEADFYILEKRSFSLQQTALLPVILHFHTVEAMLYSLLNRTFAQEGHRVLSMNRNVVGRHFDLMIGTMRASGMAIIQEFLSDSVKAEPRVSFPSENMGHYRSMMEIGGRERKEELWDSLLQAVAFYELVVFSPH